MVLGAIEGKTSELWCLLVFTGLDSDSNVYLSPCFNRKATFDMFNFLASQHRELPDITGPFEEEDDEFPLKSSRWDTETSAFTFFF